MSADPASPGVLIGGAGPSGLVLALTLLTNGIPVRIIDKARDFPLVQRGSGIQPRTLELFHYLGTLSDMQAIYRPLLPVVEYKPGQVEPVKTSYMMEPVEPTPDVPYPNPILLGQGYTQQILRAHLEKLGGAIETETELRHFGQTADGVTVTLVKQRNGEEVIETASFRWLVGTDGGKSGVRKQLGLSFEGQALKEHSIHGELYVEGLDADHWHRWLDWQNPTIVTVVLCPTEVKGQFFFLTGGHVNYSELVEDQEKLLQAMRDFIKRDDIKLSNIRHAVEYRPQARIVEKYNLAVLMPAGFYKMPHTCTARREDRHGLNTSVQDAFNLGWKLALVEKGLAAPSLLSTYSEERLPVAKRMIQETLGIYKVVMDSALQGANASKARGAHIKQLGVNYRWSPIVLDERNPVDKQQTVDALDVYGKLGGDGVPRAGDRAPDAPGLVEVKQGSGATRLFDIFGPTHHCVLIFCADASTARPVLEAVQTLPPKTVTSVVIYPQTASRKPPVAYADLVLADFEGHAFKVYGCPADSTTIVITRPDGVIGGTVFGDEGVKKYFKGIFSTV
ncbi:FAD/NAD(P)-binding domain-containing protein [Daedalea quercina L-15889]|uniref:FAD/NAD(P)-binding domain-containing protein n=1 Tax=Daedalea quercina L-15889 TaxID=1314783 RepID=A0A165SNN6_9APHY|nr:FAD/NAD(P)-binding domain-containing protein [Daedalea quercina L-15889]